MPAADGPEGPYRRRPVGFPARKVPEIVLNPIRIAVPLRGRIASKMTGLSAKRDCSPHSFHKYLKALKGLLTSFGVQR